MDGSTVVAQDRDDEGLGHQHPVDPERVAAARRRQLSVDDASRLTALLGLLADPVRVRILYALDSVEELCVGDLVMALKLDPRCSGLRLADAAHRGPGDQPAGRADRLLPVG